MDGANSIKVDLILSWPRHLDYPLWRQQIHDHRKQFKNVIVVFTNMNVHKDYRNWIKQVMENDDITFVESKEVRADEDWRNIAVNCGLKKSDAPWTFFTEPDFFWKDGFFEAATRHMDAVNVVGVLVEGRLHPCCLFVKRKILDWTRKNFGVIPDVSDHFGMIQEDLHSEVKAYIPDRCFKHFGGLSQNMYLLQTSQDPMYYPDEFKQYCSDCLKVTVPIHRDFEELFNAYIQRLSS